MDKRASMIIPPPCSARRFLGIPGLAVLLAAVALPLLIEGGTLPHIHKAFEQGIFNEEHVLAAMAAVKGDAPVSTAPLLAAPLSVTVAPLAAAPGVVPFRPLSHPDSRAPPTR